MTILCPDKFAEACSFAASIDLNYESAIDTVDEETKAKLMKSHKLSAARSLLYAFAARATDDARYNDKQLFPPNTLIIGEDGITRKVGENPEKWRLPIQETFIYADPAPHSFFFREEFMDPDTRRIVRVVDTVWYARMNPEADGITPELFASEHNDILRDLVFEGKCVSSWDFEEIKKLQPDMRFVRKVQRERRGMCGGIIYHPDYMDGQQTGYGSWSTHT